MIRPMRTDLATEQPLTLPSQEEQALPRVSVIIPTRDRFAYLRRALSSVLAQTYGG
jgi:hypothetical protein